MKRFYIYKMIHLPTGRVYIGQRKCPKGVTPENDPYHGSGKIWERIYNKHPHECVKVIIDYADTRDEIDELERKYIKHYKEVYGELCVNIAPGGYNLRGYKHTDDYKKALSEKMKGEKNHFYGKKHTDETRRKIKEARARQVFSKETLEKRGKSISIAKKGFKHSEETKRKLSEANKGRKHSEETKQKMSRTHLGHPTSDETRKKLSEANKKRWTPEYKKARQASFQKGWETRRNNKAK